MARTIYKFELTPGQPLRMTVGAKVLAVGNQGERFMLWAELDLNREPEERFVTVYGTGHRLPDDPGRYLGTAQFADGSLVFHAYESRRDEMALPLARPCRRILLDAVSALRSDVRRSRERWNPDEGYVFGANDLYQL